MQSHKAFHQNQFLPSFSFIFFLTVFPLFLCEVIEMKMKFCLYCVQIYYIEKLWPRKFALYFSFFYSKDLTQQCVSIAPNNAAQRVTNCELSKEKIPLMKGELGCFINMLYCCSIATRWSVVANKFMRECDFTHLRIIRIPYIDETSNRRYNKINM